MGYPRGQAAIIPFGLVDASDGSALEGASVTVQVVKDDGDEAAGAGTVAEKSNGQYQYAATADEMDADVVSFALAATGAVAAFVHVRTDDGSIAAAAILATPENKLATDASGRVTVGSLPATALEGNTYNCTIVTVGSVTSTVDANVVSTNGDPIDPETPEEAKALVQEAMDDQGYTEARAEALQRILDTEALDIDLDGGGRVKLQPAGMDDVSMTAPASADPADWSMREGLVALMCRGFSRNEQTSSEWTTYYFDASTVLTTQALSDDNTTQRMAKGGAS